MKKYLLILLASLSATFTMAQQDMNEPTKSLKAQFSIGSIPNRNDSLYQRSLPELTLPENVKSAALPAKVDNSRLAYLRPVFSQEGASCGQAAAVGYNFTYEMAHARGVSADTSINQYPTHFVYNFENTGWEYFGVSYFHSFEILRKCGTMNVQDYGGLTDNGNRWITGYDLYRNGMSNRIEDVYTIKTNTAEGILTLKNWVYNHLGQSLTGGVASFYATPPWNAVQLPEGTEEQGKLVVTGFSAPASHAMTIVGYNDSIKFDYNNDGRYTNNMDNNLDGIVDVRDWEIGGFRFVNSYGPSSSDSGFCYMMYRTLAEDYDHGGIWNNAVHIVKVKPNYSPLLTMKVRLNHSRRVSLRVRAGVSANTASYVPEYIMDFPIFNFQGGNFPMQGSSISDTSKSIEFGLDITPLLSYIQKGEDAAFFLTVEENDPLSQSGGSIESMTVIDYSTAIPQTAVCAETPIEISDNDITLSKVILKTNVDKVRITNALLPPFTANQPYSYQLSASGGLPPYKWALDYNYSHLKRNQEFPVFEGIKLEAQVPSDSIIPVALGFSFPFYDKKYDTVYVNLNRGYLQLTPDNIPWPYLGEESILLQNYPLIVPLTNHRLHANNSDEGTWYQTSSTSAMFRWKLSKKIGESFIPYEFQVKLSPEGTITIHRNPVFLAPSDQFHSGISNGNKQDFDLSVYFTDYDANLYNCDEFIRGAYPDELKISQDGLIECLPTSNETVYSLPCKVTDYNLISDEKQFSLTSGLKAVLRLRAGNDSILVQGEDVAADLVLTNLTSSVFTNLEADLRISNSYITLNDSTETIGNLNPNSERTILNAFRFKVSPLSPDGEVFLMELITGNDQHQWKQRFENQILSPHLKTVSLTCLTNGNELIQPGETGQLTCKIANIGHATAENATVSIQFSNPFVKLLSANNQACGDIAPGLKSFSEFLVKVSDSTPLGTYVPVNITVASGNDIYSDTLYFRVGRAPALVIDLDINHASAPVIWQQIKDLGYMADYSTYINTNINEYQSLFISLGKYSDRYAFNFSEGEILAEYLERGGNIYLESRSTWRDDLLTALQPRFYIQFENKFHKYDTLSASTGTFTEGLSFLNTDFPVSMYYMQPLGGAFSIFNDEGYACGVANEVGNYKTIGCLFDFSSNIEMNAESTHARLMQKYLDFFAVKRDVIGINEEILQKSYGDIEVFPNPASDRTYLTFTLNSGAPVKVAVYDLKGVKVTELSDKSVTNGTHLIEWNLCNQAGQKVPAGLYFCRITSAGEVKTGKIMVK
jgi:hypothetical protein